MLYGWKKNCYSLASFFVSNLTDNSIKFVRKWNSSRGILYLPRRGRNPAIYISLHSFRPTFHFRIRLTILL